MFKRNQRRTDNASANMTPMLDIVFILLIFFIVSATFLREEGIDMQPPPDGPVCDGCPAPILVQVTANSRIYVNTVPTDIERVISAVNRLRAEEPYAAVVVEAHDEANHGVIVRLWDEMQTNGVPVALNRTDGVQPVP